MFKLSENVVAKVMQIIGIGTAAVSLIAGTITGANSYSDGFLYFIIWVIAGLISGAVFFAYAEIIDLLSKALKGQEVIADRISRMTGILKKDSENVSAGKVSVSLENELKKFKVLLDEGLITEDEFSEMKRKTLGI